MQEQGVRFPNQQMKYYINYKINVNVIQKLNDEIE